MKFDNVMVQLSSVKCYSMYVFQIWGFWKRIPYGEWWQGFSLSFTVPLKELMEDDNGGEDETETEQG